MSVGVVRPDDLQMGGEGERPRLGSWARLHCRAIHARSTERVVALGIVLRQGERCLFGVMDLAPIAIPKQCFSANYGFLGRWVSPLFVPFSFDVGLQLLA